MSHLDLWDAMARPPADALRQIGGGRLKGMTDISPQWRYKVMTEQFGPCGIGWTWRCARLWTEPGHGGEVMAFALVELRVRHDGEWSEPISGVGGSMLVAQERGGLRSNDEAYKMATTDALSVAMKTLGVAADIYAGRWDGTKYRDPPAPESGITDAQLGTLRDLLLSTESDEARFCAWLGVPRLEDLTESGYRRGLAALQAKARQT